MTATAALSALMEGRLSQPANKAPLVHLSTRDGVRLGSVPYRFEMTFRVIGTGQACWVVDDSGLPLHEFNPCWVAPGDTVRLNVEIM